MNIQPIPTKRQALEQAANGNTEPLERLIHHDKTERFKSLLSAKLYGFFYNCMLFHYYNFSVKKGEITPIDESLQVINNFAYHIDEPEKEVHEKYCQITDLINNGRVKEAVKMLKEYYHKTQSKPYF